MLIVLIVKVGIKVEEVIQELKKLEAEQVFPGFQASFFTDNYFQEITSGFGWLYPKKVSMPQDFYFDLASLSKMLTAILVLKVFEKENLPLTLPLKVVLPAFENEEVTVLSLLTHTANLTGYIPHRNELTSQELKKALLKLTPEKPVGSFEFYSDHHFLLLGWLLEELTSHSLSQLLEVQINQEIDSHFTFYPQKEKTIPTQAIFNENGQWKTNLQGIAHDPKAQIFNGVTGHAGIFGRLKDLELLMENLFFNRVFFSAENLGKISKEQTKGFHRSAGFKLLPAKSGALFFGHTGYTGTFFCGNPEKKQGFIFLTSRLQVGDHRSFYIQKRDGFIKKYLKGV